MLRVPVLGHVKVLEELVLTYGLYGSMSMPGLTYEVRYLANLNGSHPKQRCTISMSVAKPPNHQRLNSQHAQNCMDRAHHMWTVSQTISGRKSVYGPSVNPFLSTMDRFGPY